jgi:hypothetical protein
VAGCINMEYEFFSKWIDENLWKLRERRERESERKGKESERRKIINCRHSSLHIEQFNVK